MNVVWRRERWGGGGGGGGVRSWQQGDEGLYMTMKMEDYIDILEKKLKALVQKLKLVCHRTFHQHCVEMILRIPQIGC